MENLYTVKFSNQNMDNLIMGEVQVSATSAKKAVQKVGNMVFVPGGAFFFATGDMDEKKAA